MSINRQAVAATMVTVSLAIPAIGSAGAADFPVPSPQVQSGPPPAEPYAYGPPPVVYGYPAPPPAPYYAYVAPPVGTYYLGRPRFYGPYMAHGYGYGHWGQGYRGWR
jgi:hypothetical protein